MRMKTGFVMACGRQVHYTEVGRPDAPAVMCWHGIARTGRVFRPLASALAARYRVICPDVIGRGLSEWSPRPKAEYHLGFYARIAADLLDALSLTTVRWVGISLGGAIGVRAAGGLLKERITHLVVDDMGPALEPWALDAIREVIEAGARHRFKTMAEFQAYQYEFYKSGGPLSEDAWRELACGSVRRCDDGTYAEHYDPRIGDQFVHHPQDWDQWPEYDAIRARTLCIRGEHSPLLSREVAEEMTRRGPRCRLVEIPGVGHAPQLIRDDEISLVEDFLTH